MTAGKFADRAVLVTGASAGIGRATAHEFAREGADVALVARTKERLDELATLLEETYDVDTLVSPTDVREERQVESAVERTVDAFGRLDVVVSNAGCLRGSAVEELTTAEYRTMMETNVDGTFFLTRAAIPHLRQSNGNLIVIGSFAGQYPRPFNPVYAATKWWVRGFAHSVEASVGSDDVAVSVVNPSEVRTEIETVDGEPFTEQFDEGEVTEPEEVAKAVCFAAGQENSTISELDIYRRDKFSHF